MTLQKRAKTNGLPSPKLKATVGGWSGPARSRGAPPEDKVLKVIKIEETAGAHSVSIRVGGCGRWWLVMDGGDITSPLHDFVLLLPGGMLATGELTLREGSRFA